MRWIAPFWRHARRHGAAPIDILRREGFVAIDLETTGLDPRRDAIVAAAAVPFIAGARASGYVTLVNPERTIPPESTAIHGITNAMVADAPAVGRVVHELDAVCAGRVVIGHGVAFDAAVLARERRRHRLAQPVEPALCTMRLAAALHPGWADLSLEAVAARLGITVIGRHSAEGDAVAAGQILLALLPSLAARGLHTVGELVWLQDSAPL
jgi:DNA polymerase III epsilon subunit family exonuclease